MADIEIGAGITIGGGITFGGAGGGGGGFTTPFSYSASSEFTNSGTPGLEVVGNGSTVKLVVTSSQWSDTSALNNLIAMPSGTSGNVLPGGWFPMTYTTTSVWVASGGTYEATATGDVVTYFLNGSNSLDQITA